MSSIFFPRNIFTNIFVASLEKNLQDRIVFEPSAVLSQKLKENVDNIALIPTTDIYTNKNFFISKLFGLSFEGSLSNSYLYFNSDDASLKSLVLYGDVSTIEIILSKLIFKELYKTDIELSISTDKNISKQNCIIIGDANFEEPRFSNGISFAEQVVEIISAPFVNYVLASNNSSLLKDISSKFTDAAKSINQQEIKIDLPGLSKNFITENIDKVFFNFTEQEIEGINQLINLPYYHGIINDIIEVKFV